MGSSGSKIRAHIAWDFEHFLDMLNEIACRPYLCCDSDGLRSAIDRYLLMMNLQIDEAASPEVLWVWYLHVLHPLAYAKDCTTAFGQVIPFREIYEHAREVFEDGKKKKIETLKLRSFAHHYTKRSQFSPSVNLVECAKRMSHFVANAKRVWEKVIELDPQQKEEFFEALQDKYVKFLRLMKKHPNENLAPIFDIELAWHAHLRFPIDYAKDTQKIFGSVLDHTNEYIDPSPDAIDKAGRLWQREFGEAYDLLPDLFPAASPNTSKKTKKANKEEQERIAEHLKQIEKRVREERVEQEKIKQLEKEQEEQEKTNNDSDDKETSESYHDSDAPPKRTKSEQNALKSSGNSKAESPKTKHKDEKDQSKEDSPDSRPNRKPRRKSSSSAKEHIAEKFNESKRRENVDDSSSSSVKPSDKHGRKATKKAATKKPKS